MAVVLVETDIAAPFSSGTTVAFTIATSPPAGSLLLANVTFSQYQATRTCTPPAGWLLLGTLSQNNASQSVYWRIAGASEPTSVVFTINGASADWCSGELLVLSGTATSAPTIAQIGGNSGSPSTPSLAPVALGAVPLAFFAQDAAGSGGASINGATGWTTDGIANTSYHCSSAFSKAAVATLFAQQCVAQTISSVAADYVAAIVYAALAVAAAGGATGNAGNATGAIGTGPNPGGAVGNG